MDVKALLRQFNLRPKKSLGQNFLVDEHALSDIVRAAEITSDDVVLEIGPGLGSLTLHLADVARHVIAIEIDRTLMPPLRSVLSARSNITLVEGDILKLDPVDLLAEASLRGGPPCPARAPGARLARPTKQSPSSEDEIASLPSTMLGRLAMTMGSYKVVANIPYYITSAI